MDYLSDYRKAIQSKRNWSSPERQKEFEQIVQTVGDEVAAGVGIMEDQSPANQGDARDAIFHAHREECMRALELWKKYSTPV